MSFPLWEACPESQFGELKWPEIIANYSEHVKSACDEAAIAKKINDELALLTRQSHLCQENRGSCQDQLQKDLDELQSASEQTRSLSDNCFKLFVNSFGDLLRFRKKKGPFIIDPIFNLVETT